LVNRIIFIGIKGIIFSECRLIHRFPTTLSMAVAAIGKFAGVDNVGMQIDINS
jgi:hypothetical protein